MPSTLRLLPGAGPGPTRRWLWLAALAVSVPLLPWASLASPAAAPPVGRRERLWGDGRSFQALDFVQGMPIRLKRSRYALLIRPEDHGLPLSSLSLRFPDNFDGSLIQESLRLCRMLTPPAVQRSRCAERLPARLERPSSGEVLILPETPLAGAGTYGLSLVLFNPSVPGRYPLRLFAGSPDSPQPTYRGTWLIPISPEED